jgi:hypothetical protein
MANQIVVSAGAKVRNLSGVLTATSGVVSFLPIDVSLGIPQLDVNGKILVSQLPNSVMEYKGTWDISTNTPTLVNGTGNQGDVYLVEGAAVGGTSFNFGAGGILFFNGDQAIYSGSIWQRGSGATGSVTSISITESGDSLNITGSPITTSGTINIGFNGTNLQYVNGAGNLTTFPILTGYVPYTGATGDVNLGLYSLTSNSIKVIGDNSTYGGTLSIKQSNVTNLTGVGYTELFGKTNRLGISFGAGSIAYLSNSTLTAERTYTFPDASGTIALTSDIPSLTGYVPYTGATANVDLGAFDLTANLITGATGSFASSGGSDTFAINHSSGGGIALNITKGGNGEGLYINKTSGSGNAATIVGTLEATTLVKNGGTSSQFLKADGTVDSNTYALDSLVVHLAGTETITGIKNFNLGLTLQDGYYPTPATGYVGLGSNGSGITILTKSGITVYNNNLQFPNASNDYNFPNATGTIALTSDLSAYVTLAGTETITGAKTFSATSLTLAPTSGGGTLNLKQDAFLGATNGYTSLTSSGSDFAIIAATGVGTSKQAVFSLASLGATLRTYTLPDANGILALTSDIPSLTGYVTLATTQTITGIKTFSSFDTLFSQGFFSDYAIKIKKDGSISLLNGYVSIGEISGTGTSKIVFGDGNSAFSNSLLFNTSSDKIYTFPNASGTIALTSDLTGGTVTSVAALTIGTTGTDLSSTVANSTTTPVITLNVPTASATNRGALSSADWTTFNNKQSALTNPVTGTGTTNYLPKFTGASTIGNSLIYDNGTNVGIGTTSLFGALKVKAGTNQNISINSFSGITHIEAINDANDADVPLRIDATRYEIMSGNFLINTTTDSGYKLDVNGTGRFSGGITLNRAAAGNANGYILQTAGTSNWYVGSSAVGSNTDLQFYNHSATSVVFNIANTTGAATFSSSVTAAAGIFNLNTTNGGFKVTAVAATPNTLSYLANNYFAKFYTRPDQNYGITIFDQSEATAIQSADLVNGTNARALILNPYGGNVGIGTASPSTKLQVTGVASTNSDAVYTIILNDSTGYATRIGSGISFGGYYDGTNVTDTFSNIKGFKENLTSGDYAGAMSFQTRSNGGSPTERMRITSGGNVGIGTASPNARLSLGTGTTSKLLVYDGGFTGSGGNGFFAGFAVDYPSGNDFGMFAHNNGALVFGKYTNNNDLNNVTERMRITSGGQVLIGATSYDGVNTNALQIKGSTAQFLINNTVGTTNHFTIYSASDGNIYNVFGTTGNLLFGTGAKDTSGWSEKMRITSGGNVLIGGTSAAQGYSSYNLALVGPSPLLKLQSTTSAHAWDIYNNGGNNLIFAYDSSDKANINQSTGVYTATSDINKKKDFEQSTLGLNAILGLKPTLYRMKEENNTDKHLGFIAQEVKEFIPQAFVENDGFIGLDYQSITATLVKAIQEQQKQIEELKQIVATINK